MEAPLETDPADAAQRMRDGAILLDVREPDETTLCSVPGSRLIPLREVPAPLDTLPRDTDLLVLCHSGGRSWRVTHFLRSQGFRRAINVAGGIDAWAQVVDPSLPCY